MTEKEQLVQAKLDETERHIEKVRDAMRELHRAFDELVSCVGTARGYSHWNPEA